MIDFLMHPDALERPTADEVAQLSKIYVMKSREQTKKN